jgi:hypothetical protein
MQCPHCKRVIEHGIPYWEIGVIPHAYATAHVYPYLQPDQITEETLHKYANDLEFKESVNRLLEEQDG